MTDCKAPDSKALAAAAKARGNKLFSGQQPDYKLALAAYTEAISHDPENHILWANSCAAHLKIAGNEWNAREKVDAYALALETAQKCTQLDATWAKGFIRQSTAEFELVAAREKWEDRREQDEKYDRENPPGVSESDEEEEEEEEEEDDDDDDTTTVKDVTDKGAPERKKRAKEKKAKVLKVKKEVSPIVATANYAACEASARAGLKLDTASVALLERLQSLRDAGFATDEAEDRKLQDVSQAAREKADGNQAFSARQFARALTLYTKAMCFDPFNHVFYSNRSACFAEQDEWDKALRDGVRCVELKPDFAKGYSRKGAAEYQLGQYGEAEASAKAGLVVDAENAALKDLLALAQVETKESLATQRNFFKFRQEKKSNAKLQSLMKGFQGQGGVQMFNGANLGGNLGNLFSGMGGGGMGSKFQNMNDNQIRDMARQMATS